MLEVVNLMEIDGIRWRWVEMGGDGWCYRWGRMMGGQEIMGRNGERKEGSTLRLVIMPVDSFCSMRTRKAYLFGAAHSTAVQ